MIPYGSFKYAPPPSDRVVGEALKETAVTHEVQGHEVTTTNNTNTLGFAAPFFTNSWGDGWPQPRYTVPNYPEWWDKPLRPPSPFHQAEEPTPKPRRLRSAVKRLWAWLTRERPWNGKPFLLPCSTYPRF